MKWLLCEPKAADMIRVKVGRLYHYGIYISDGEVIQFGPRPNERAALKDSEIEVISTDIDEFLGGGFVEVCELDRKERKKARGIADTVEYARSKIGMRGYNIIHNNCEHFAYECRLGERISTQTEDLRAHLRSLSGVDVYLAKLPPLMSEIDIKCKERITEISSVSNERVKREKYYAWRLLEYAAERSLGVRAKKAEFKKEASGAWTSPHFEFSISHSGEVLAVAVARTPVGVDIEGDVVPRAENFAQRVLASEEFLEYQSKPSEEKNSFLTQLWTKKEAIFKRSRGSAFVPERIVVREHITYTERIFVDGTPYTLSVATDTPEKIKIIRNVLLEQT